MSKKSEVSLVEKKAKILIKLRKYQVLETKEYKNATGIIVKTPKRRLLVYCIPSESTVGVAYVNQLAKILVDEKMERGVVVTNGRYTQAARKKARKHGIELIPRIFPAFNLFDHVLVPKHEILARREREELLAKYRVEPYQLPRIKVSDPAVIAIGAKAGDVVRVIRNSPTAGEYAAYRYVVQG